MKEFVGKLANFKKGVIAEWLLVNLAVTFPENFILKCGSKLISAMPTDIHQSISINRFYLIEILIFIWDFLFFHNSS